MFRTGLLLFLLFIGHTAMSQVDRDKGVPYKSALKFNVSALLNGSGRIAFEQRITRHVSLQLEAGKYFFGNSITLAPQVRFYKTLSRNRHVYIGLGYYYKQHEHHFRDSVRVIGTSVNSSRDIITSKYINTATLNAGFLFNSQVFKHRIRWDCNIAVGQRFKQTSLYGLAANEEIDLTDAYILREQAEENTHGQTRHYFEFGVTLRIIVPLRQ